MLVELDGKAQAKLIEDAIRKAGSERKLGKITGIPDVAIHVYKKLKHRMPYRRFKTLAGFLGLEESGFRFELIDPREFHSKGGRAVQKKYLKENRLEEILKNLHKHGRENKFLKQWHAKMKKENPDEYHKIQFNRFKGAGRYKCKTERGEIVRNQLEAETANIMHEAGINYEYESFLRANRSPYFPDFKIGNMIIECTEWRSEQKAYKLLKKINDYEAEGLEVKVVVSEKARDFYKPIQKYIISKKQLKALF